VVGAPADPGRELAAVAADCVSRGVAIGHIQPQEAGEGGIQIARDARGIDLFQPASGRREFAEMRVYWRISSARLLRRLVHDSINLGSWQWRRPRRWMTPEVVPSRQRERQLGGVGTHRDLVA
jgi:hypothetical protein